jgi:hypothetical protein
LYFTAALRESVTTIAFALSSSRWATLAWKCSTMICTFWLILVGWSFTHRISPLRAAASSTTSSPSPLSAQGNVKVCDLGVKSVDEGAGTDTRTKKVASCLR